MANITLEQLLDTVYFGNPNNQQIMIYTNEDYYKYDKTFLLENRTFIEPEFTIGCSTTMAASHFIKKEWLVQECYIIDICADGNIRVVLDMGEDNE